jgi:DNA-binding NtrC family response regulator
MSGLGRVGPLDLPLELQSEIFRPRGLPHRSPAGHLRELENEYIQEILAATGNNKTQASRILGIHPT